MLSREKRKGKMKIEYTSTEVFRENVNDNFGYRMQ